LQRFAFFDLVRNVELRPLPFFAAASAKLRFSIAVRAPVPSYGALVTSLALALALVLLDAAALDEDDAAAAAAAAAASARSCGTGSFACAATDLVKTPAHASMRRFLALAN